MTISPTIRLIRGGKSKKAIVAIEGKKKAGGESGLS
jgi:hypothetical protein